MSGSPFSHAPELDASRSYGAVMGRGHPREVRYLDPRCRGEHVLFVCLREWDTQTFGTTYLASFDTPASPLNGF
jgi:hypothetical protein